MAKKPNAVYEPGELDRVRKQLGNLDPEEARRIAEKLGGEVGTEKAAQERRISSRDETVDLSVGGRGPSKSKPTRRVELGREEEPRPAPRRERSAVVDPEDDPAVPIKPGYRERLRMDRYAAQAEFEVKNATQVIYSMITLFGDPPDYVNPDFVTRRMNEYYQRLETLVTATRTLLPRNNLQRNERLRRESAFHYAILDVLRYWNIERISSELARIQARPRTAKTADFIDILKCIYRPLYVLEKIDPEAHIKEAYRTLYKLLLQENAMEAKEKHHGLIKAALASYSISSRNIRFYLYPLLLKLLSDRWLPYDAFFDARKNRLASFLGVSEKDRLSPPPLGDIGVGSAPQPEEEAALGQRENGEKAAEAQEKREDPEAEPRNRALKRGIETLETLFPKAGWQRLHEFPDLFPYFAGIFDLKKGYDLIAPNDALQQVAILMLILEELFYALRYVSFGTIAGSDGGAERADEAVNRIVSGWHDFIEGVLEKQYLPRLGEYCRLLDAAPESRTSTYAKRTLMELYWLRRLYFLPYFRFESVSPPPFRRQELTPIYTEVRTLRRILTAAAAGIERGSREGGAEKRLPCDGIDNPWEPYVFQVPNPLSVRLDALLGGKNSKRKTNAALVFYTLAVITVLDHLINEESSWAYGDEGLALFRSVDGEGILPLFGVDERVDAELIFKESLKKSP